MNDYDINWNSQNHFIEYLHEKIKEAKDSNKKVIHCIFIKDFH